MNRLLLLCLAAAASGCAAVGPDFEPPSPGVDLARPLPSAGAAGLRADGFVPAAWWTGIEDPLVGSLVMRSLEANNDLRVAEANLLAARALLLQGEADRLPTGSLAAATERARAATPSGLGPENPVTTPSSANASFSWELDLFGRVRRQNEARRADVEVAAALRDDLSALVASDVARAYVDLREAQQRRLVAERNLANQRETARITAALVDAGRGSEIDTVRVRSGILATEASLPILRAAERGALNRLTTLLALGPGALDAELQAPRALPGLPQIVTTGNAAALLRTRPDIRAAEFALREATAQIGVSTAELFPSLTLDGRLGVSADRLSNLSGGGASFLGLGPSLSLALFDRNAIHARIAQAEALAAADLATYQQTVLLALEEADSALSVFVQERARRALLGEAVVASRRASDLARLQFESGSEPLLTVLDAERTQLAAEDAAIVAQASEARALVAVYRAFGGGYRPEPASMTN